MSDKSIDELTVTGFGDDWERFDQSALLQGVSFSD